MPFNVPMRVGTLDIGHRFGLVTHANTGGLRFGGSCSGRSADVAEFGMHRRDSFLQRRVRRSGSKVEGDAKSKQAPKSKQAKGATCASIKLYRNKPDRWNGHGGFTLQFCSAETPA